MNEPNIGARIKKFREAFGISQFDLEILIGASPGSLSRIESGKTNPTKETIFHISHALKLTDRQISYLFGLDFSGPEKVLEIIHKISSLYDLDEITQTFVNEVSEQLGYVTVAILLLDKDQTLVAQCYAQNRASIKAMKPITQNFKSLFVNKSTDHKNYLLRSALERKVMISEDFYDFSRGAISKPLIKLVQSIVSIKQGIAIPLAFGEESIGTVFYSKQDTRNYAFEIDLLEALSRQIALVIHNARQVEKTIPMNLTSSNQPG